MSTTLEQTRNTHKSSWKIAVVVGALATMAAGAMPAVALDQQATEAQMDDAANRQATGSYASAYGYVPAPHRSGPYASARPERPAAAVKPHKDFQDYK